MEEKIKVLQAEFEKALSEASTAEALEELRIAYLGKRGHVASLMQHLREVEDKRAAGQMINGFGTNILIIHARHLHEHYLYGRL